MARGVDLFMVYQLIRKLTTPFDETEAYKLGIINKDGEFLKTRRELRTTEERKALGVFDVLVFNLKKILARVPGGRTRLGTYAAAMWLIKEGTEEKEHINSDQLHEELMEYYSILEDGPTVSAGSGNIAGIGIGPKGEPGVTRTQQRKHRKRNKTTGPIISSIKRRKDIEEAFDRPEKFTVKSFSGKYIASTNIDGKELYFNAGVRRDFDDEYWSVIFSYDDSMSITGTGNQVKIFSTVVAMFKDFVEKKNPDEIQFTAEKQGSRDTRTSLYERMLKRFAKSQGYSFENKSVGVQNKFVMKKEA